MGLVIESLVEVRPDIERAYWVYLLNYGLAESMAEAIKQNFVAIAERMSQSQSVIVMGTSKHFSDEVLNWHHVFGLSGDEYLPALLISTRNPHDFNEGHVSPAIDGNDYLLIPLRQVATTGTDAVAIMNSILTDIENKTPLAEFSVLQRLPAQEAGPQWGKTLVLKPSFMGVGLDLGELYNSIKHLRKK
ncbi:MAG: hypothetical protein IT205_02615 [Fimbriimonadaceae bacterium]|nr:hypothetical protein [Fimbriimonadaceae bacterium]